MSRRQLFRIIGVILSVLTLTAGPVTRKALAESCLTCLGPATNAVPLYHPTGAFQRAGPIIRRGGKPLLLFIGAQWSGASATERWPLVKALAQFGTFSHLATSASFKGSDGAGSIPTFDLLHATYRSSLLSFVHKDLEDGNARPLQHLSSRERQLLQRYGPIGLDLSLAGGSVKASLPYRLTGTPPMILVGGYVMNTSFVSPGLMGGINSIDPTTITTLSFSTVQKQLQAGYTRHYIEYVFQIDAETNVLTALICHADGKKPISVCNRPVIKTILKHVK